MIDEALRTESDETGGHRRAARIAGRAATAVSVLVLAALIAVLVLTRLPVFGYRAVIISGGSMEPAIDTGALLLTQRTDPEALEVGDIITFRYPDSDTSITHRIVSVQEEGALRLFATQGDANETPDADEISFEEGRAYSMLFSVPYAGYLLAFVRSPLGILLLAGAPLAALMVMQISDGMKRRRGVHETLSEGR